MPRLRKSWKDAKETSGGSFDIEPGAYKLVITKVEPYEAKEYWKVYWDVAEGPAAGTYAKSSFPPSEFVSYKESAYGMLKHRLHVLAKCNPQRLHAYADEGGDFGGVREFDEDDYEAFVGCRFPAVVHRRLYTAGPNSKQPGADRTQVRVARWLTPEEFRDESWPKSLLEDQDDRDADAAPQAAQAPTPPAQAGGYADIYEDDVPF